MSHTLLKQRIRTKVRKQRRALSVRAQQLAGEKIGLQLRQIKQIHLATCIGSYLPFQGEASAVPFHHHALAHLKKMYLPIVLPSPNPPMAFAPLKTKQTYSKNRFGILEPDYQVKDLEQALALDVVLCPLVAFDNQGNRLGMGGGFYDKSLATGANVQAPYLIGIAYSFQRFAALPTTALDIRLNAVVTPQKVWYFP